MDILESNEVLKLINLIKNYNFLINGRSNGEKKGKFTFLDVLGNSVREM